MAAHPTTVKAVRALVPAAGGDLRPHDRSETHWIFDTKIGSPMSRWPEYREDRRSTPRVDVARQLGFVGGKLPLPGVPAEGEQGLAESLELAARMRAASGASDDPICLDLMSI